MCRIDRVTTPKVWRRDDLIDQCATVANIRARLGKIVKGSWGNHGGAKFPETFGDGYCLKKCHATYNRHGKPFRVQSLARYVALYQSSIRSS